jgi:AcrR family transcriptional regulator
MEKDGTSAELNLRDLARQLGVSHAAPYRHFADKKALLVALAEEGFKELLESMASRAPANAIKPEDQFRELAGAYVRFALAHPAQMALMFSPDAGQTPTPSGKAMFELVVGAMQAGQLSGEIASGDPMHQAVAAWALVHGFCVLIVNGRLAEKGLDRDPEKLVEEMVEILLKGLAK